MYKFTQIYKIFFNHKYVGNTLKGLQNNNITERSMSQKIFESWYIATDKLIVKLIIMSTNVFKHKL